VRDTSTGAVNHAEPPTLSGRCPRVALIYAWPGIRGWSIFDALQVTARAREQEQLVLDVSVDLESIRAAQEFLHRRLRTVARRSRPIRPQISRQILNQLVLDDN